MRSVLLGALSRRAGASLLKICLLCGWFPWLGGTCGPTAWGQPVSPFDEAPQLSTLQLNVIEGPVRARLQSVQTLLEQHDWEAAIDSMRALGDESGGQLVGLNSPDARFQRFVPLSDRLHNMLCSLPEDQSMALTVYRQRVDLLARTWYERGVQQHDRQLLTRLVRELFSSSWGDNAALALGDLALERGEPDLARSYWRRLHRSLNAEAAAEHPRRCHLHGVDHSRGGGVAPGRLGGTTRLPRLGDSPAGGRARMLLATLLEGTWARAADQYQKFCSAHPQAEGPLGGRHVLYVEALGELLQQARQWPIPPTSPDWLTFAGNPRRNGVAGPVVDVSLEPAWKIPLDPPGTFQGAAVRRGGVPEVRVAETDQQLCSCHPVVVGSRVLVASQNRLRCFELDSGRPVAWASNDAGQIYPSRALALPSLRQARGAVCTCRVSRSPPRDRTSTVCCRPRLLRGLRRTRTICQETGWLALICSHRASCCLRRWHLPILTGSLPVHRWWRGPTCTYAFGKTRRYLPFMSPVCAGENGAGCSDLDMVIRWPPRPTEDRPRTC